MIMMRETVLKLLFYISHSYLIAQRVELGLVKPEMKLYQCRNLVTPVSPRLRGAELAGSARVHLDPDLVALLGDVADAVQLISA